MAILDLQTRLVEEGRIRMGEKVEMAGGQSRPKKLDTWRFTSADKDLIDEVAMLYHGDVKPWVSPEGSQWEVVTEANAIKVIIQPVNTYSQFMEKWEGRFLARRCDTQREQISDRPCICKAEEEELCKPVTRVNLMLRDVKKTSGVWRLETHGWNATQELGGMLAVLQRTQGWWPAELVIETRTQTRMRNGKPETRKFPVPRFRGLEIETIVEALKARQLAELAGVDEPQRELERPPAPGVAGAPSPSPTPGVTNPTGWAARRAIGMQQAQQEATAARQQLDESATSGVVSDPSVAESGEAAAPEPDPTTQPDGDIASDPASPESGQSMEALCTQLNIPNNRGWLYLKQHKDHPKGCDGSPEPHAFKLKTLDDFLGLTGEDAGIATDILKGQFQ